jgi:hypothetical protein
MVSAVSRIIYLQTQKRKEERGRERRRGEGVSKEVEEAGKSVKNEKAIRAVTYNP